MAKISSFSGAYGHNLQMEINYGTVSQDKVNNISKIRVWVVLKTSAYGSLSGLTAPLTIGVNGGRAIENVGVNIGPNSSSTIFSKEYNITHDSNGDKSVPLSATLSINTSGYGEATTSANYKLESIPRISTVSVGQATTGGTLAITINRKNVSAKHTIRYGFGTQSGTIASDVATSYTWSVPASLASQMPNITSSKGTIWVDTYFGSTKVGTSAAIFDINIPDSFKPSLTSISLTDGNSKAKAVFPDNATYVQEISNIIVTFNGASGNNGSTIVQYEAIIVGKNNSTTQNGGSLGSMPYNGQVTVRARVQDTRGRWSDAKDVVVNVLPYHTPRLSFSAVRGGKDGSEITIKREAVIAPLTVGNAQKNRMALAFKVAKGDSTSFVVDKGPAAGTWLTQPAVVSEALLAGKYTTDYAWTVEGILSDSFTMATFRAVIPTAAVTYAYDKEGRFAVGTVPDRGKPNSLIVAGDIYVGGKLLLDIFYPVGTIYESTASANPSTFMGGTWERFGNGRVLVGVSETEPEFNSVNKSGGAKTHTLTVAEMPSHDHGQTILGGSGNVGIRKDYSSDATGSRFTQGITTEKTGGGQAHNNLQPYVTVYRWRRTA